MLNFTCVGLSCVGLPARFLCPTCVKLGLPKIKASFCSQECFRQNWSSHKTAHSLPLFDPFESSNCYTGSLRALYPLSPTRKIPSHILKPDYADSGRSVSEERENRLRKIEIVSQSDIDKMRILCREARHILDCAGKLVAPGVTTDAIDAAVHAECLARNCYPSPLNYYGFPKSCCTSVNEVICHGIPDSRELVEGDIINIDVSIFRDGLHADLNETYAVGCVDSKARKIVDAARECLKDAISCVKPGMMYRDIGQIIQDLATCRGVGVNRTYCGHGIHRYFHCAPTVPHYAKNKAIGVMRPGHIFTIEPMLTLGDHREAHWPDNWTAVTRDGSLSAQFEHTILVTPTGYEVLTLSPDHDVVMNGLPTDKWGPPSETTTTTTTNNNLF